MNNFEESIKELVNEKYGGNSEIFLKSLEKQTYTFLIFGGISIIMAMIIYQSGKPPYFTGTVGGIMFLIGVFSHRLYNKCFKLFNNGK